MRYSEVVDVVNKVFEEYEIKLTVRQIYYRLISPPYQLFANTMNNYKQFDKILTKARERGDVDWERIEDRARAIIGGDYGWNNPDDYLNYKIEDLKNCDSDYTRAMWDNQLQYVEVWVEKDALATLFSNAVRGFRVVTFPSRGYSSFTKVMEAIKDRFLDRIQKGQQIIILHFSDHDPSGLDMGKDLLNRLKDYLKTKIDELSDDLVFVDKFNSERPFFQIFRVALTFDQVKEFNLAPNPTKSADPRAKDYVAQYGDQCWELDAVPPDRLPDIIKRAVQKFIEAPKWNEIVQTTEKERQTLKEKLAKLKISFGEE